LVIGFRPIPPAFQNSAASFRCLSLDRLGEHVVCASRILPADRPDGHLPLPVMIGVFASVSLLAVFKDIKDAAGDAAENIWTIANAFPRRLALSLTACSVFAGAVSLAALLYSLRYGLVMDCLPEGIVLCS